MVLDLRMGQVPYFPRVLHEATNYSTTPVLDLWMGLAPYLSRGFSLVYKTNNLFDYRGTRSSEGHTPYFLKGILRP